MGKKRVAEVEHRIASSLGAVVQLPQPGALPWLGLCTKTVASLLLLAQACAVTLRDSFIAACATAPSLIKQSYASFLSSFLCLANNQRAEPWSQLGTSAITLLFQGHLAQLFSYTNLYTCAVCFLLPVYNKQGNTSWAWAPTSLPFVSSPIESIATQICDALLGTHSGVTGVPLSHGEGALTAWQRRGGIMRLFTRI